MESAVPEGRGEKMAENGDIKTNTYKVEVQLNQKAGTVDILMTLDGEVVGGPENVNRFDDPDTFPDRLSIALLKAVRDPILEDALEFFEPDPPIKE